MGLNAISTAGWLQPIGEIGARKVSLLMRRVIAHRECNSL